MKASAPILALVLIIGVALSCKLSDKVLGEDNSVMVTELWPDVPPFPGAIKTENKLPLAARILTRTFMKGKVSFISFHTDKPEQEVKDFYSGESMKTAGWSINQETCFRDTKEMKTGGALCTFQSTGAKTEAMGIMVQHDSSNTQIFYIRMDLTQR